MKNGLIDLLAAYGPVPDGNAMYDELVSEVARTTNQEPLVIPETASVDVLKILEDPRRLSVILTGTAGDGKTYTARTAFKALRQDAVWTDDEAQTIDHPATGARVTFVKDLSEVDRQGKAELVPRLLAALAGPEPSEQFVICANDGHLLRTWRDHGADDPRAGTILGSLREMLRDDLREPPSGQPFRLINMSRRSHAETLAHVLKAMLEHQGWSDCPAACPGLDAASPCPIRLNREVLRACGPGSIGERLRDLISIAAADSNHLSLRQVMILVVNALLGDARSPQRPLLTCQKARSRAEARDYGATNPYANLLGENHPKSERERNGAFTALRRWGVGEETANAFDDLLLDEALWPSAPGHPFYGTSLLRDTLARYMEEPGRVIDELRPLLRDQRRRLFFTLPPASGRGQLDPWDLTLLHSGEVYVNLLRPREYQDPAVFAQAKTLMLKGLNRVLTGAMTETADSLWLTQPSGVFLGREVPLRIDAPMRWRGRGRTYLLDLEPPRQPGRPPALCVVEERQGTRLGVLDLTPTLFEYLARVAEGALPTSFSSQCLQDVRSFQIQTAGALAAMEAANGRTPELHIIDVGQQTLQERTFPIDEATS